MAEVINLRRARKSKARAEREAEADANRRKHGAPASERKAVHARNDKAKRDLEGLRLDRAKE